MPRGPRTTASRAIRLLMASALRTGDLAAELGITRRGAEKVLQALREDWRIETTEKPGAKVGGFPEKWHRIAGPKKGTRTA